MSVQSPQQALSSKPGDVKAIHIVCGGDDAFAMPIAVMLHSATMHLPSQTAVHVYVLDNGISETNQDRIRRCVAGNDDRVRVTFLSPRIDAISALATNDWLNVSAYMRLLMAPLLPSECGRILYIDADMIVERDLTELWREPFSPEESVLAVRDYGIAYGRQQSMLAPAYAKLGLDVNLPYLNSGLMLIDLVNWREHRVGERALQHCADFRECIYYADQDGLNLALANGGWREIDPLWNVQVGAVRTFDLWPDSEFKERVRPKKDTLLSAAHILHFTGKRKPWVAGLTNPARARFDYYLRHSSWFRAAEYAAFRTNWFQNNVRLIAGDLAQRVATKATPKQHV